MTKQSKNYLSVREYGGDVEASRAFNIHEKTVRSLDQALELVLALLVSERWVEKIFWHVIDLETNNSNNVN